MNPERTIAIAITRKFRATMDDTFRPKKLDKQTLYGEIEQAMEDTAPYAQADMEMLPEKFKAMFKEMVYQAKQEIIQQQRSTYDSMLTDVISDALFDLEQYFKKNYSESELSQIAAFVESDAGKKMMFDMGVTKLLTDHQNKIREALNEIVYQVAHQDDIANNLSDLFISMNFQGDTDNPYNFDSEYDSEYDEYEDDEDNW